MLRSLTWLVVFILVGAIMSVTVAWACALWRSVAYDNTAFFRSPTSSEILKWQSLAPSDAAPDPVAVRGINDAWGLRVFIALGDHSGTGVIVENPDGSVIFGTTAGAQVDVLTRVECGWPFRCLVGEHWNQRTTLGTITGFLGATSGNWSTSDYQSEAASVERPKILGGFSLRLLPYRPALLLFVLNAIFYALLLRSALWAWKQSRGAFRRKRGQCPACGYPSGEAVSCSECGHRLAALGLRSSRGKRSS